MDYIFIFNDDYQKKEEEEEAVYSEEENFLIYRPKTGFRLLRKS